MTLKNGGKIIALSFLRYKHTPFQFKTKKIEEGRTEILPKQDLTEILQEDAIPEIIYSALLAGGEIVAFASKLEFIRE